ncbi:hypothetical protein [Planctomicrobium piriforme]|uniref:Uncharacterized protein n=1 Tax=Planctomicrobium piriforme TaxID=1576369 RepID=A0A1I3D5D3_9PLAN|nr:hypothetical protein [Planctomicrobium piriforme]SFH81940.1 hypothetical protein SAMN05421753_10399 [Planctomicrobium piriforme]
MSGGAAAAGAAAVIQAIKAMGVVIQLDPDNWMDIVCREPDALVVHSTSWFFGTTQNYLTSYKGLAFYTRSTELLHLPPDVEVVEARKLWMPGGM